MAMTSESLKAVFRAVGAAMQACADELNSLDGTVGDGDLGITMSRGTREVMEQIDSMPDDVGMALLKAAQAFTKTSASTFGTLIAIGLMSAAKAPKAGPKFRGPSCRT